MFRQEHFLKYSYPCCSLFDLRDVCTHRIGQTDTEYNEQAIHTFFFLLLAEVRLGSPTFLLQVTNLQSEIN